MHVGGWVGHYLFDEGLEETGDVLPFPRPDVSFHLEWVGG